MKKKILNFKIKKMHPYLMWGISGHINNLDSKPRQIDTENSERYIQKWIDKQKTSIDRYRKLIQINTEKLKRQIQKTLINRHSKHRQIDTENLYR